MNTALIFDIKRFAVHDGPGIRTTVFFKGCPLSCPWCHNPEGQKPTPEIFLRASRCIGCADCLAACPTGALSLASGTIELDRGGCDACGKCADVCPTDALETVGRVVTLDKIIAEIERDTVFYDSSGGGVTFSGGEPLGQPEFLIDLLHACRDRGVHSTIDTSGYATADVIKSAAETANLFLYDLKLSDDDAHRRYTGVTNRPILDNLRLLSDIGATVIVRVPVIPGITDTKDNIAGIARFVASLDMRYPIDLLPYHRAGSDKYARLGIPYRLADTPIPSRTRMEEIAEMFLRHKLTVMIGGERYGDDRAD